MSDERILSVLRGQAWERAKGEVEAMFLTYYGGYANDAPFKLFSKAWREFVKEVENNGWTD